MLCEKMKTKKKSKVAVQLNMDVIAEILSRLCVKDLIKFKSVCKAWLELISSNDFIKLHLHRSRSFRPILLEDRCFDIDCHQSRHPASGRFCGSSCDGLVCLFDGDQSIIHIWNPALRSSACIRMKKRPPNSIYCYWFGLHNGDYKLVLGTIQLEMHVIRPYKDSCYNWKSTHLPRDWCCPYYEEIGTLVNGNVHWPACEREASTWTIMSYNLHQETAGEIVLPVVECLKVQHVRLGEVDGCLSSLLLYNETRDFELWAMKEYGVKESWTKMMVLNEESAFSFDNICPIGDVLDDHATIKSPLYRKEWYIESLVSPKLCYESSLRSRMKSCRIMGMSAKTFTK